MGLHLFDTMTHQLRPVEPLEPDHVRIYTCGPTVYDRSHIGNFRTFVFEDVLRRWLERRFSRVTHVMNLTDVEDKIIRNAVANHRTLDEQTAGPIVAFFEDLDALGIRRAHHYPRATHYIDKMVDIIEELGRHGMTYESEGSIYFRISAFPGYGKLSGVRAEGIVAGASGRVDATADEYTKDDVRDFALWKQVGPDEIGWDTRLGRGRPGWHIECSAMSMDLLGESFDIHCGGVDNIFPHHENEIAQSEGATGKPFVKLWVHAEHLRIGGEKMAKSAGNFSTLRELLNKGERPSAVRYLLAAGAHYRKVLNYSDEALRMSAEAVDRLVAFRDRVAATSSQEVGGEDIEAIVQKAQGQFDSALDDDLNLTGAMGVVFAALRDVNRILDAGGISGRVREKLMAFLGSVDDVLGVFPLVDAERSGGLSAEEQSLLDARAQAREQKEWKKSDEMRDALLEHGVVVEDTPQGQRWQRRSA